MVNSIPPNDPSFLSDMEQIDYSLSKIPENDFFESSIESLQQEKDKSTNIIVKFFNGIVNSFLSFFSKEKKTSSIKNKYNEFVLRYKRVDLSSEELVKKEANEYPTVYLILGRDIFKKSYNVFWKIWVSISFLGHKTYYEIGKELAETNIELLKFALKKYYRSQILNLEKQFK